MGSVQSKLLSHRIRAYVKGILRRRADQLFPSAETRRYGSWIRGRVAEREREYQTEAAPGLFSVLTAVWDGSPPRHLRTLAESIVRQNQHGDSEWVILDNGCSNQKLVSCLKELSAYSWVKIRRVPSNAGITKGLRLCLEHATGRYVLPVDADDVLYDDAFRVIASEVRRAGYPPLLYTDEDKVIGSRVYQPYFKPDWDPVLLLNSAYIAHLGVMDRRRALELGVYSDRETEGSPDWDAFVRFLMAGHSATHIPEVVYSWRVHAQSTADDAATKPYIQASQKAVLRRLLEAQPQASRFEIELSSLFGGAAHWHFARRREEPKPFVSVEIDELPGKAQQLATVAQDMANRGGLVHLVGKDVQIEDPEWFWEALGLFELHPEAVMIGGRIQNKRGIIAEAGRYFGFGGVCGCPYRGRPVSDPGYFGQMWKQRSVSAVSTQFAVVRADFLLELLGAIPEHASVAFLGAWAGAHALRTGQRVVYSPFLSGISDLHWDTLADASEVALFEEMNRDIIPDTRFYSRHFSLTEPFGLQE